MQAVGKQHVDTEDQYVGLQPAHRRRCFVAVYRRAHDLEFRSKDVRQDLQRLLVIVSDDDSYSISRHQFKKNTSPRCFLLS